MWGNGGIIPFILSLYSRWLEWSNSLSGRFPAAKLLPGTHYIGGWVGPRACVDAWKREKISHLLGMEAQSTEMQPVA